MRLCLLFMSLLASSFAQSSATESPAPWVPDRGDGTYQNPVLFADYSDPDVVRVGEDYWLTSSSFSHVPGLPILHSRDLVNWSLVNHALPALDYADGAGQSLARHFSQPQHGGGIWAPSIRFHAGKFWIFFPDPDYGLYVTTTTDPRARWSAPVLVKAGKGLIDPCPLWDDDGKVFLVHGWARSRAGKNNQLTVNELSADATRVLDGEGTVVVDENTSSRGWTTLEGPKFYRHAGEYWIFAPVGGVTGGSQAVYRAKNVRGPYEARIVLAQGATAINGPHQGGWVDTPMGEYWFVHFQDRGPFGRVVHLEPMSWGADGWPRMGTAVATGAVTGEPVRVHQKPAASPQPIATPATSDEFDSPALGLQWQWQANPRPEWATLTARPGWLRLLGCTAPSKDTLYDSPNLLLQKFPGPRFTATAKLDASGLSRGSEGAAAGLIVFGYDYAWIGVAHTGEGLRVAYVVNRKADKNGHDAAPVLGPVLKSPVVHLRVLVDTAGKCRFAFSTDGTAFTPLGDEFQSSVSRWVGAKVGLFASCPPIGTSREFGHADFDWFRLTP